MALRLVSAVTVGAVLVPALALAVGTPALPRLHPGAVSPHPTYVRAVEPAMLALSVTAPADAPSSAHLGGARAGSGIVFDARGYAVTVSYVVLDATRIQARTRDGTIVEARLVGVDFDTGLAVIRLEGAGPWPTAPLGDSRDMLEGALVGTIGVDEDNELVYAAATLAGVRRFSAFFIRDSDTGFSAKFEVPASDLQRLRLRNKINSGRLRRDEAHGQQ